MWVRPPEQGCILTLVFLLGYEGEKQAHHEEWVPCACTPLWAVRELREGRDEDHLLRVLWGYDGDRRPSPSHQRRPRQWLHHSWWRLKENPLWLLRLLLLKHRLLEQVLLQQLLLQLELLLHLQLLLLLLVWHRRRLCLWNQRREVLRWRCLWCILWQHGAV